MIERLTYEQKVKLLNRMIESNDYTSFYIALCNGIVPDSFYFDKILDSGFGAWFFVNHATLYNWVPNKITKNQFVRLIDNWIKIETDFTVIYARKRISSKLQSIEKVADKEQFLRAIDAWISTGENLDWLAFYHNDELTKEQIDKFIECGKYLWVLAEGNWDGKEEKIDEIRREIERSK